MSGHRGQRGQEGALLAGGRPGPLEEDSGDLGVRERQWLQGHHAVGRPSTCGPGCAVSDSQKRWPLSADRRRRRVVCYLFPPSAHLAYVAACCGSDSDSPLDWMDQCLQGQALGETVLPLPAAGTGLLVSRAAGQGR